MNPRVYELEKAGERLIQQLRTTTITTYAGTWVKCLICCAKWRKGKKEVHDSACPIPPFRAILEKEEE